MRITTTRRSSATLLAGAALIALATTACGPTAGSSVSTKPKQTASGSAAAPAAGTPAAGTPAKSGAKTPTVAKTGDTIALKGFEKGTIDDVTLVKVVDNAQSANDYAKPADGKRWIAVQFRVKDTGTTAFSDAPDNDATAVDDKGQSYNSVVADTTAGPSFAVPANVAPGDTGLGFITFEVPADAKIDKVQFVLDNGVADQAGQWKLS